MVGWMILHLVNFFYSKQNTSESWSQGSVLVQLDVQPARLV